MKSRITRFSATALALVVCLSVSLPLIADSRDPRHGIGERVARIAEKIQHLVRKITTLSDFPGPPKP